MLYVQRPDKACLSGFQSGPTQTGLYSLMLWLEVLNLGFRKNGDWAIFHGNETKGADQLRGNRSTDLCLCSRICKKNSRDVAHIFMAILQIFRHPKNEPRCVDSNAPKSCLMYVYDVILTCINQPEMLPI